LGFLVREFSVVIHCINSFRFIPPNWAEPMFSNVNIVIAVMGVLILVPSDFLEKNNLWWFLWARVSKKWQD
jgi:hypothetical protein